MKYLLLFFLGLSPTFLQAADEPASGDKPKAGDADTTSTKSVPKEELPKKTEYDKLPLPQLLAKAKTGNLTAQFELGSRFNYGRGMPKNTAEGLRWLRKAGQGGQEDAARLLAVKLYNGYDVMQDFVEAMKWARMLAEAGDIPAQSMLASMYANGEGVIRDLVRAYMWYAIAAVGAKRTGSEEEPQAEQVQAAIDARDKLAALLTEEQETEAQKLASDWWMQQTANAEKGKSFTRQKPAR